MQTKIIIYVFYIFFRKSLYPILWCKIVAFKKLQCKSKWERNLLDIVDVKSCCYLDIVCVEWFGYWRNTVVIASKINLVFSIASNSAVIFVSNQEWIRECDLISRKTEIRTAFRKSCLEHPTVFIFFHQGFKFWQKIYCESERRNFFCKASEKKFF